MSFGIPVRNGLGVGLLASTTLSTRNRAPFSPASLFATGEQGAWYDPSDLTTLFQDSAGTTPVTAAAQQVGLALDKSQGLVLGPELVTNGDFATDTDWINSDTGTGTSVISGGVLTLTFNTSTNRASRDQSFPTTAGSTYRVTCAISLEASKSRVDIGTSQGGTQNAQILGASAASFVFRATASTTWIRLTNQNTAGTIQFDNVSVKLLAGNHAFQSNSAQRPTLGREPYTGVRNLLTFTEQFDNAAWAKTNATVTANAATAPDGTATADRFLSSAIASADKLVGQQIAVSAGNYTFSIFVKDNASAARTFSIRVSITGADFVNATFDLDTNTISSPTASGSGITAISSSAAASLNGYTRVSIAVAVASSTNVTCRLSAPFVSSLVSDLFIWGAQLETGSTATAYQRVVSSFDVTQAGVPDVWYLSFDGTDDGMLTGTITPGIDKAQVFAGVRKLSNAAISAVAETSATTASNNGSLALFAPVEVNPNYGFRSRGTGSGTAISPNTYPVPITNVVTGIGDIAVDTTTIRINGTLAASNADDQGTGNYLAYPLYIGRRGGTTLPFNGNLFSLILRFGTNLSAATIRQTETWVGDKTGINIPLSVSPTIYDRFNDTVLDRDGQTIEVR